ncbi:MAG: ABC transporter substrate-binding protein [Bacillota bacterium]
MRKSLALFVIVVLLVPVMALTAGCSGGSKELLIGNIQDLSGPNKAFGVAMTNAAQMYIAKLNTAGGIGGKQLKMISYDTKSDVNEAINAYNRLVDQDKVLAVLGPPIANMGIALAPISVTKKVPIVGLFMDEKATTDAKTNKPYDYMFLAQNSAGTQARIMASYAINELKLKTFAVLYNQQNAYSVSLAEPFIAYVTAHGGTVVDKETFLTADKDYKTQLTKIKQSKPEAIYMPTYPQEIPLSLQQAYELQIKATILGDNSYIPFATASNTDPKAAEGVYFPYGVDPADAKLQQFAADYKAKWGIAAIAQSYSGWDAFGALADAIKRAYAANKKVTPDMVAAEMNKTKDYAGYQGALTISPDTHRPVGLPMVILQIKGGKPTTLTQYKEPTK